MSDLLEPGPPAMPDPIGPDRPDPVGPAGSRAAHHRSGKPIGLLALSVVLLVLGAGLAYLSLRLRWGYFDLTARPLTASDWATLSPADRAKMTVWWGDTMNGCWCGPLPLICPALALLSALPLFVAAMRQRAASRLWTWLGVLSAAGGCAGVLVYAEGIVLAGELNDGGWLWDVDGGTLAIALSGYALLTLGILALTFAALAAPASTRSASPAAG